MSLQRETILQALFNLLSASSSWATAERRLVYWNDQIAQPAFFQRYVGDHHPPQEAFGIPQMVVMQVEAWIYAQSGGPSDAPEDTFLPLLDALDTALAANSTFDGRQTLGMPDYVHHVWREGESTYSQGELGTQIVLHIPINILVANAFRTS